MTFYAMILWVFLFVLVFFCDQLSVLRFQLKAVIGQCSQDEFKVWHPAPALLLVWVHTVLWVFFGKWAEGAASLLICEATMKYLLLFWMQQAMQGCGAVGNVLSTMLHFNQHLSCNSAGLGWIEHYFFTWVIKINVLLTKAWWNSLSFYIYISTTEMIDSFCQRCLTQVIL